MHPQLENYLAQVKAQIKSLPLDKQEEELQEIQQHLLALVESGVQNGDSEEEAVAAALRQFGGARRVGRSLKKAWLASSTREGRMTTPINRFVSAAIWYLALNAVTGVLGSSVYGAWAGLCIGSQLKQGVAPTAVNVPALETWLAVVTYSPEVVGMAGLVLALWGRLPIFHLERKAR